MEAAPARALLGESLSPFCSLCLWLGIASPVLCLCFLCPAKRGQGRGAATAHAQVKGYKNGAVLFYTDILGDLRVVSYWIDTLVLKN